MMIHLTRHPLDVNDLLATVQSAERGGTCLFFSGASGSTSPSTER